jgi:hypothetical protein
VSLSLLTRKRRLDAIRIDINASGGGAVHLYPLPEMPSPEAQPSTPPLAIVALAADCALVGESSDLATLVLNPVVGLAAATGLVAWARFVDGAGIAVYDAPAGPPGSGKPVIITDNEASPSALVRAGGEVRIALATWVE